MFFVSYLPCFFGSLSSACIGGHILMISTSCDVFLSSLTSQQDCLPCGDKSPPILILGVLIHVFKLKQKKVTVVFTARRLAKRGICRRRVSVCLSVCLSVTLRYCIKMARRRIMQIMPHDSSGNLVFCCQKSLRNSNGITPYGSDKCRWGGLKLVTFDEKCAITR